MEISGEDRHGEEVLSKQLMYCMEGVDNIYLSKECSIQLGILDPDFPSIGGARERQKQDLATAAWMGPSEESGEDGDLSREGHAGEEDQDDQVSPCLKMQFMKDYSGPRAACGCPVRELPPPLPETLPFDLVPENQQQIQDWLQLRGFGFQRV